MSSVTKSTLTTAADVKKELVGCCKKSIFCLSWQNPATSAAWLLGLAVLCVVLINDNRTGYVSIFTEQFHSSLRQMAHQSEISDEEALHDSEADELHHFTAPLPRSESNKRTRELPSRLDVCSVRHPQHVAALLSIRNAFVGGKSEMKRIKSGGSIGKVCRQLCSARTAPQHI